jgi:microcystin-dependent protein
MPLETATYISDLVPSNPAASDGMNNADDHMRLIKAALKTTFPSISGVVTATHTQLNNAVAATVNGVSALADTGTFFKTSGDGFANTLAGDIDVMLQGSVGATFQRTAGVNFFKMTGAVQITGTITSSGAITAPGIVPIGAVLIWPSDTLPPSTEGTFTWCNGVLLSRTTYATLFARISTLYGAGDGSTTFGIPNYQEVVLTGKSGMGGASSPGLLTSIATGIKDVLGVLFGTDTVALTAAQIPTITSNVSTSGTLTGSTSAFNNSSSNSSTGGGGFACGGAVGAIQPSVTVSGSMSGSATSNNTGGAAHSNLGPRKAVNYIIRIA